MQNILKMFSNIKVLVVGDLMIDQYWWGKVDRISPEAPVPVVHLNKKSFVVGGAANVAANIVGLGAKPYLIGVVGDDVDGNNLLNLLEEGNIETNSLIISKERPTTVKTRIIAHNQHVVRIDQEDSTLISHTDENSIIETFESLIDEVDIVLISDYAKGVITKNIAVRLITTTFNKQKYIVVDPKGKNYSKYKNATVMTPNQKEALEANNLDFENEKSVENTGKKLLEDLSLECLVVTRGKEGMTLFQKGKEIKKLEASARKVYDVTGAGDTVIATLTTAIGVGLDFQKSAKLANIAAGKVVEQIGTSVININDLQKELAV